MIRNRGAAPSRARTVGARVHWVTLAAVLLAIAAALAVQGYAHHLTTLSESSTPAAAASPAPAAALHGGPVIDPREGVDTVTPHQRTIALTFDDGPDPTWTPREDPPAYADLYARSLDSAGPDVVAAARIPIERFAGEMLPVAGGDLG